MVRNQGRVTRFVVMAVLQAARGETLGLPLESAYSWGLNRAIFYAAAKRGFRGGGSEGGAVEPTAKAKPAREAYRLGDEEAYRTPGTGPPTFVIGEEAQSSAEFERAVVARFGTRENFRAAWETARSIVAGFDRPTLESRRRFYDEVYRPRRDKLSDDWTLRYSPPIRPKGNPRSARTRSRLRPAKDQDSSPSEGG